MYGFNTQVVCLVALFGFIQLSKQTLATEVSGEQSGTWTVEGSPYLLVGDVLVSQGDTLRIDPGVVVIGMGRYKITVDQATLLALGTAERPILMTAEDTTTGWRGIRLENANDDTVVTGCVIEYSRSIGASEVPGGALLIRECSPTISNNRFRYNSTHNTQNLNGFGGAICAFTSSAVITGNIITENTADAGAGITTIDFGNAIVRNNYIARNAAIGKGGAMYLAVASSPVVEYNVIIGNQCEGLDGGGISSWTGYVFYLTFPTIRNNLIAFNTTNGEGGGLYCRYDRAIIANNVIAFNSAGATGGGMYVLNFPDAVPLVDNTIIWGNTAAGGGDQVYLEPAYGFGRVDRVQQRAGRLAGGGEHGPGPVLRRPRWSR